MVRRSFAIFLFALLAGLVVHGVSRAQDKNFIAIDPPKPLPAFVFEDEKGRILNLKEFQGRYVLLNLWATSCLPCIKEMPALNALSKKLDSKKFVVIALAEDVNDAAARIFYKRHGIDHLDVYNDASGRAPFVLKMRGIPTTLLIDPKGAEIARLEGPADWTQATIISYLENQP